MYIAVQVVNVCRVCMLVLRRAGELCVVVVPAEPWICWSAGIARKPENQLQNCSNDGSR